MQFLEDDINGHQEMFASLNENGQQIMAEMEPGDVLTAVQAKLDDMNDRCQLHPFSFDYQISKKFRRKCVVTLMFPNLAFHCRPVIDRWQSLNVRTLDIRDRLEETGTEWRQLLMDLQEIIDWIARADQELTLQQPIGGDLESVQNQNEMHQVMSSAMSIYFDILKF